MKDKFRVDVEELAEANPRVNLDQLRESLEIQADLRRLGHENKGFDLTMPFERVGAPSVESGIRDLEDQRIFAHS